MQNTVCPLFTLWYIVGINKITVCIYQYHHSVDTETVLYNWSPNFIQSHSSEITMLSTLLVKYTG